MIIVNLWHGTALECSKFVDFPRYVLWSEKIKQLNTRVIKDVIVGAAQN